MRTPPTPRYRRGFTLVELLVVVAVIGILASLLLPTLSRAKERGRSIQCVSNLRQLDLALTLYAGDHGDQMPPRHFTPYWTLPLYPYYRNVELLKCPTEQDGSNRSYIFNGWNDHFESTLSAEDLKTYMDFKWPDGMKLGQIPDTAGTITFGEKRTGSPHAYMDFLQGGSGNDLEELEHGRHGGGNNIRKRSSNYAFADGSVRSLNFGLSITPVNFWAVTDKWRNGPPIPLGNVE